MGAAMRKAFGLLNNINAIVSSKSSLRCLEGNNFSSISNHGQHRLWSRVEEISREEVVFKASHLTM